MFTEEHRARVWEQIHHKGVRCFWELLTPQLIAEAALRTSSRIIRSPLCLGNLVWLAIAAALHQTASFSHILMVTFKLLEDQACFADSGIGRAQQKGRRRQKQGRKKRHKHDPRRDDPTQVSEEAFVQARQRMPLEFWVQLMVLLGEAFQAQHRRLLCFRGFRVLSIDGTTLNVPDHKALREEFGTSRNALGSHGAQARLVLLQFPFARLPYRYQLVPLAEAELTVAHRLVAALEANDLLVMDAGFFSYGLFWEIQQRGAYFAIRLPRKLNVKRLRKLGPNDYLVRWRPKDSRGKWRSKQLPEAMELRVIHYQIAGFRRQAIVTNVLDALKLPQEDWVRLTTDCQVRGKFCPGLYHRRWEIETTFRELKVEQGMETSLRSRTPASLQWEVAGHVVLYLLVRWLIVEAALKEGLDPLQLSFLNALRELFTMRQAMVTASMRWARTLYERLLERVAQHQVPRRPGRHHPRGKKARRQEASASKHELTSKQA